MLSEKRAEIQNINQNPALSQAERSRQIQNLYSPASTLASVTLEDNESEFICRICFDGSTREDVISPCACSGSSKWVHRACLDKWRTTREDRAFSRCTECLKSYTLISTSPDTNSEKCWRKTKFILYVFRDLSIAFVLTQSIVFIIAWVVWCSDGSSGHGYLIKLLRAEAIPNIFYYLCGLVISLAIAGASFYAIPRLCPGSTCSCPCPNVCDGLYCYDPYCYHPYAYHHPGCVCCDCGACCGQATCDCCGHASCCECAQVGGCEMCAGIDFAGDAAILLIFVVIVMAIVGFFVVIYMGSKLVNDIMRSHISVLQKRGFAEDFIVADLEEIPPTTVNFPQREEVSNQTYSIVSQNDIDDELPVDLHRDGDLEMGCAESTGRGCSKKIVSNLSESQERELRRLGLICSDEEATEFAERIRRSPFSDSVLTQRRHTGPKGR